MIITITNKSIIKKFGLVKDLNKGSSIQVCSYSTVNKLHNGAFSSYNIFRFCLTRKINLAHVIKRTMINSRCLHAAKAAYYCLSTISNDQVLHNTTKENKKPLVNSLLHYAMNHDNGIIQHKSKLTNHVLNHQFSANDFYESYQHLWPNAKVTYVPEQQVKMHAMAEIPVLHQYHDTFGPDLIKTVSTFDSIKTEFPNQHQPNPDFLVYIDRAMGLGKRATYQDEKAGVEMIRHSTRGSIGILTFDSEGKIVPFTTEDLTLKKFYNTSSNGITAGLKNDGLFDLFKSEISSLDLYKTNSTNDFINHQKYQQFIWNTFQSNPSYNRSVSFIFDVHLKDLPINSETKAFAADFCGALVSNHCYNLDKRQDCRDITKAMIFAYSKNYDPNLIKKLQYLQYDCNIEFNRKFLEDVASLVKQKILIFTN